jgi:hypothetical protein
MSKRGFTALLLLCVSLCGYAQRADSACLQYNIKFFVQTYDSTGNCDCHINSQASDNETANCNQLGSVMINVYHNDRLFGTVYTDYTGYSPSFGLCDAKYRVFFLRKDYDTASIVIDYTAHDLRNRIYPLSNCTVNISAAGNNYNLCVVLNVKKKRKGVRMVPRDDMGDRIK